MASRMSVPRRDVPWHLRTAGALIMAAAFIVLIGIMTAEALYPGYHTGERTISALVEEEPSGAIFTIAMVVGGTVLSLASLLLPGAGLPTSLTVPALLMGVGCVGVGLFPMQTGAPHVIAAALALGMGGIAALMAARAARPPFSYISLVLGAFGLASLLLFAIMGRTGPLGPLGEGGVERLAAYADLAWAMVFGGHLMGKGANPSR